MEVIKIPHRISLQYYKFGSNHTHYIQCDTDGEELDDTKLHSQLFICKTCGIHICHGSDVISREFHGSTGKAYLFNNALNLNFGLTDDRRLRTGIHSVQDCFCVNCNQELGWTYVATEEESQRYKIGKFVLELSLIRRKNDGRSIIVINEE
jgi:hypothetical protein